MIAVSDLMARDVEVIHPDCTLQRAAQLMAGLRVGILPVVDGSKLVGVITDRDITIRATSRGLWPARTLVADVMSPRLSSCLPTEPITRALEQMNAAGVTRLLVVDDTGRAIGYVSRNRLREALEGPPGRSRVRVNSESVSAAIDCESALA